MSFHIYKYPESDQNSELQESNLPPLNFPHKILSLLNLPIENLNDKLILPFKSKGADQIE